MLKFLESSLAKATIQIHEYLALTYDYETASGTREFWKQACAQEADVRPVVELVQEDEESWRVWACGCGECDSCVSLEFHKPELQLFELHACAL